MSSNSRRPDQAQALLERSGPARVNAALAGAVRWSLVFAMAMIMLAIVYQVVMRYCFGRAPSWTEEFALLMFAWATLGGLALGVRESFHVRLTILLDRLPARARSPAERALAAATLLVGAYLLWSGWRYVAMTTGGTSAAIAYPVEVLHGLAPVAGALVMLFSAERLFAKAPAVPPVESDPIG